MKDEPAEQKVHGPSNGTSSLSLRSKEFFYTQWRQWKEGRITGSEMAANALRFIRENHSEPLVQHAQTIRKSKDR